MSDETPVQVILDDLPAIDWANQEINDLLVICPRCVGAVFRTSSAMRDHERWHAAIENLTVHIADTATEDQAHTIANYARDALIRSGFSVSVADLERGSAGVSGRTHAEREQPNVRELARLRDLEQWLLDRGAPGNTEEMIDWLRDMFDGLQSYRRWRREAHVSLRSSTRLHEVVNAAGCPPGADMIDWVREQLAELDWRRKAALNEDRYGSHHEPVSPSVAGIIDAQHAELLRLAAKGRRAYAGDFPHEGPAFRGQPEHLRHEARTFEAAARLIEDPRRLAGLIPTSMQTWSLDDDVSEVVAKATGIRVVLLDPPKPRPVHPDEAVWCDVCQDRFRLNDHYHCPKCRQRTGMMGHPNGCPNPGTVNTTGVSDEVLSDLLLLVGVTPSAAQLSSWTPEQREQAANWARLVHLDASDNDVDVPERPEFLNEQPAEPCPSLYLHDGTLFACAHPVTQHVVTSADTGRHRCGMYSWTNDQAVPVPWPLDQEPPTGINVLEDIRLMSLPGEQFRYLCRVGTDRWSWEVERRAFTSNEIDHAHSSSWTEALDNGGRYNREPLELHVVRP